jgi:hypothetical protein
MNPLVRYYLHQAGGGYGDNSIGPIYSAPPILQRGHGIGSVLTEFWRWIKPILWKGAKSLGRETMRTGGKILSDLADNTSPNVKPADIVSKRLSESAQNVIGRVLRGRGKKRKRNTSALRKNKKHTPAKKET